MIDEMGLTSESVNLIFQHGVSLGGKIKSGLQMNFSAASCPRYGSTHIKKHLVHIRPFLSSLAVFQVTRVTNYTKCAFTRLRSLAVHDRRNTSERLLYLHETDIEVLGTTTFEPTFSSDDPFDMTELRIGILDRRISLVPNVCLDFSCASQAVAPIVAAMTGRDKDIRLDEPARAHRPFTRGLELVVDEKFHNGYRTYQYLQ